jgi:L-malate glycosyltransferase
MKKKKVYVICPFPKDVAAGQRLKYEQYFDDWKKNGYTVKVSPFMSHHMWNVVYLKGHFFSKFMGTIFGHMCRLRDLFLIFNYDIVYVFMWVTPLGTTIFERLVRFISKKLVYDLEDNTVSIMNNEINRIVGSLKNPRKVVYLVKYADHVITSSPSLNNYCYKLNNNKKSTYISSSVNIRKFLPANLYNNEKKVTIGWTGTFSSKMYLDLLRNVFIELGKKCEFKLLIIGNFEYIFPEIDLEVVQWSSENEVEDLQRIDIGVYPLSKDQWVLGKSGLKAIQYMSFAIPTVATNVGTTSEIITHLKNGYLVYNEDEWVNSLYELVNNPTLRKRLGTEARKTVVNNYSTDVINEKYLSILDKL